MEKTGGQMRKDTARIFLRYMNSAFYPGIRTRDYGNRTGGNGSGNIIFPVKALTLEGTKNRARNDFTMVDGKARHNRIVTGLPLIM